MPASWYQTILFKLFCGLAAFLSRYLFYRYRMRQVSDSLRVRFDERLEERTRLARDLHDTLIQTIQGGKLVADHAREAVQDMARMRATIDLLSDWLGKAIIEGRAVLASLRVSTIEENDLVQALRRAADACRINNRIDIAFSVRGESRKMHPIGRDEVFHIGHEAIQNACAHSAGAHVTIEVEYGRDLRLRVTDDGRGMDEATLQFGKPGHFGLHGMRERAQRIGAKLMLASSQNGTEVVLLVPGKVLFK
jgi:signal transduction histidine kinase